MERGRERPSVQFSFLTASLVPAFPILEAAFLPDREAAEVVQVWDGVGGSLSSKVPCHIGMEERRALSQGWMLREDLPPPAAALLILPCTAQSPPSASIPASFHSCHNHSSLVCSSFSLSSPQNSPWALGPAIAGSNFHFRSQNYWAIKWALWSQPSFHPGWKPRGACDAGGTRGFLSLITVHIWPEM